MSNFLQPHELQYTRLPFIISWILLKLLSMWVGDAFQPAHPVITFPSCSQSFPSSGYFLMSQFLTSCGWKIEASATGLGLSVIFKVDVLQDWLVWSSCCPRDSQEYSPAPQFTPAPQLRILKNFPQLAWSTESKALGFVNKADFFLELSCFFYVPTDVGNLISGSSFLNPASTSGSSQFTYCWSQAWRILSISLLACEVHATGWKFEHSLVLPFFGTGMKTDLFQFCGPCWVFQLCCKLSEAL